MGRRVWFASAGSAAFAAGLIACVDLFHSTSDFRSACDIDAQTEGCAAGASADAGAEAGESDFCNWTADEVRRRAERACAWLGACETPIGRNAIGPCMVQARLAYDCGANPNHRVHGKARSLWDCLWRVNSCPAVDACIFPKGPQTCGSVDAGDYVACGTAASATANNFDVRLACDSVGGSPHAENCALWGQTCAPNGINAVCLGARTAGLACTQSACGAAGDLHWCDVDSGDVGIDCATNGAGRCVASSSEGGALVACAAESEGGPCVRDASASCASGVATSCPSGLLETINCAKILGSPSACVAGALAPPFDWTSACALATPQCATDSCNGNTATGCWRGAPIAVDCTQAGLGPCVMATTNGAVGRAACTVHR